MGSVFKITQSGQDGVCADPQDVPECANYYGDLQFQPEELVKAGVDPEAVGINVKTRGQISKNRVSNTFTELQLPEDEPEAVFRPEPVLVEAPIIKNSDRIRPPTFRNRPQVPQTTTTTTTTTEKPILLDIEADFEDENKKQPAVVKAGEDYYYYYYYYDDDETTEES